MLERWSCWASHTLVKFVGCLTCPPLRQRLCPMRYFLRLCLQIQYPGVSMLLHRIINSFICIKSMDLFLESYPRGCYLLVLGDLWKPSLNGDLGQTRRRLRGLRETWQLCWRKEFLLSPLTLRKRPFWSWLTLLKSTNLPLRLILKLFYLLISHIKHPEMIICRNNQIILQQIKHNWNKIILKQYNFSLDNWNPLGTVMIPFTKWVINKHIIMLIHYQSKPRWV